MKYRGHASGRNRTPPPSTAIGSYYSTSHFLQGQHRRALQQQRRPSHPHPHPHLERERERERSRRNTPSVERHYDVPSQKMHSKDHSLYHPQRQTSLNSNLDANTISRYGFEPTVTRIDQDNNPLATYVQHFDDEGAGALHTSQSNDRLALHSGQMGRDSLNDGMYKDVDLTYLNQTQLVSREYYKQDQKRMSSSRNVSYPIGTTTGSLPLSPNGLGKFSDAFSHDQYKGAPTFESARETKDLIYSQGSFSSSRAHHQEYTYHEIGGMHKDDLAYSSDELYRKMQPNTQGDYENRVSTRRHSTDLDVDSVIDTKQSYTRMGDEIMLDHQLLREEPVPSYPNMNRKLASERDVESLSTGGKYLEFGERVMGDHENSHLRPKGTYDFGVEADPEFYDKRVEIPPKPECNQDMYRCDVSRRQSLKIEEVDKYELSNRVQKRKHHMDEEMNKYEPSNRIQRRNHHMDEEMSKYEPSNRIQRRTHHMDEEMSKYEPPNRIQRRNHHMDEEMSKYEPSNRIQRRNHQMDGDMSKYEPSNRIQRRNHHMDEEMSKHATRIVISNRGDTIRQVHELNEVDEDVAEEDVDVPSPKASVFSRLQPPKNKKNAYFERAPPRVAPWQSKHGQHFATKRHISTNRKLSIKKPLRHFPLNVEDLKHIDRTQDFHTPDKSRKISGNDHRGRVNADNDDPSEHKVLSVKHDPPEGSEEFKQLVDKAFLRFYKHVNETSAQRRRYTEEGKAGTLPCSICISHLKEERAFGDTHSLVLHSFSSKTGSRVDHLGLHKALCVLMGWNSNLITNTWVQQVMPVAEAAALKENLILWPPLVIIHNSSIGSKNPDEQKVVTVEGMELILKDLGFSMAMTEVCRGKPANQSIMVVKFKPTLSGLQEAERLHKYYSEIKRGREEFLQFSSSSGNNSEESIGAQVDNPEPFLYGYLGIADDLDKLEYETKKRCVVKSKKEIQKIADASLKTE